MLRFIVFYILHYDVLLLLEGIYFLIGCAVELYLNLNETVEKLFMEFDKCFVVSKVIKHSNKIIVTVILDSTCKLIFNCKMYPSEHILSYCLDCDQQLKSVS